MQIFKLPTSKFTKAFTILKNIYTCIYKNEMFDVRLECKFRMSKLSLEKKNLVTKKWKKIIKSWN
jgi:hypothetical protein